MPGIKRGEGGLGIQRGALLLSHGHSPSNPERAIFLSPHDHFRPKWDCYLKIFPIAGNPVYLLCKLLILKKHINCSLSTSTFASPPINYHKSHRQDLFSRSSAHDRIFSSSSKITADLFGKEKERGKSWALEALTGSGHTCLVEKFLGRRCSPSNPGPLTVKYWTYTYLPL